MNYRHAFHAGNFADLVKHAALLETLARMGRPLTIVDTHAGAGRYDLAGPEALRTGEAASGVGRMLTAPDPPKPLAALATAVRKINRGAETRIYPGSPWLVAEAIGPGDQAFAFEIRPQEHADLSRLLRGRAQIHTRCIDGFAEISRVPVSGAALALIDPPYERADDYVRAVQAVRAWVARDGATAMIWTPLKDLETLDAFVRDLADACPNAPLLVAETRMRALSDPTRLNGCALVYARPPAGLAPALEAICGWTAEHLGEAGAAARIWTPGR